MRHWLLLVVMAASAATAVCLIFTCSISYFLLQLENYKVMSSFVKFRILCNLFVPHNKLFHSDSVDSFPDHF